MIGHSRGNALAAYQTVATHGGVAAASAHGLILLLLDGALERVSGARLAIREGDYDTKARMVNGGLAILDELRRSLDFKAGGALARSLDSLYDYCQRQLIKASVKLELEPLDEVAKLLKEIRAAWVAIRAEAPGR